MLRKILFAIMFMFSSFAFATPPTEAQNSGCGIIGNINGYILYETFSVTVGTADFSSGDVFSISGGSVPIRLTVTGTASFTTQGTTVSYTIPEDGTYSIGITSVGTGDTTLSASCSNATNDVVLLIPTDGRTYNHWALAIYDIGDGRFEVWGDCVDIDVCQLIAIVNVNLVDDPRRFKDYDGGWYVDVYAVANTGRLVTFQFNVYNGAGILIDDDFTVEVVVSVVPTTIVNDPISADSNSETNDTSTQDTTLVLDTDGDGIIDSQDDCPLISGLPFLNGCVPGALLGSEALLNLPGENVAASRQCFNVLIIVGVPRDRTPEPSVPPSELPTLGGQLSIFSIEGNLINTSAWSARIFPNGTAIYDEQVVIPENSAFAADLAVGILDEVTDASDPFQIRVASLTALQPNCTRFSTPSALFDYASQVGAYGDIYVEADSIRNSCTSTVSGVPIVSSSC